MAKRQFKRQSRVFINPYDKTCVDCIQWDVRAGPVGGGKRKGIWEWDANLTASKYLSIYATCPAELRVMDHVQKQINLFRDAADEAIALCEEENAKGKEST